ncbi:MAG: SCO family protein [Balneolaceae bacterium]
MKRTALFASYLLVVLSLPFNAEAQLNDSQPEALQGVGIDEHLGDFIPVNARFATSNGDSVTIGSLFQEGKPIILNPLYFECPMLCGLVLDGVLDVADELAWTPGEEYQIISFSIDPKEDHVLAREYKAKYTSKLKKNFAQEGWHFLTGNKSEIDKVIDAVGFKYTEVEGTGEFAHSAAIIMLSPDGKITRYLYGIQYNEFDVRNALYESADGKIGSTAEKILMYCYQYDPDSNSYVPIAVNFMKIGGLATLIILGIFLGLLWLREQGKNVTSKIDHQ